MLLALALAVLALQAQANDPQAARLYEDALKRYEQRDVAGAIVQLKNALRADRRMLQVHLLLGRALLDASDVVAAEVAFNEALRLGVDRAEVVLPLARAVLAQGQREPLFDDARFSLQGLPAGTRAALLLLQATAHADLGRPREALQAIEQSRELAPGTAASFLAEVPIRVRLRQFDQAAAAAERAVALAPQQAEAHYLAGTVAHVQSRLSLALEHYSRALRQQPDHHEALLARAGIALDQDRLAEARIDVQNARRSQPKDPRAVYLAAQLAERTGDSAAARAALVQITELLDPVAPSFLRYRPQLQILAGLAHHGLGQFPKARPHFEALVRGDPGSPVARLLGQILLAENNPQRAGEVLQAYLRVRPGDTLALNLLAAAQIALGRPGRAAELLQDALAAPATRDDPLLRTQLGLALARAGREAEAMAPLEAAYARDPNQLTAGIALVQLHLAAQRPARAVQVAQSLVQRQPQQAALQELLGLARWQADDTAGARTAFGRALQLDPQLRSGHLSLARLDAATGREAEAQQRLQSLLRLDDKQVDVLTELGWLAERRGDMAEASRLLSRAVDQAGGRATQPGLNLVDFHLRGRRYAQAQDAVRSLAQRAPEDVGVLLALARVALAQKDNDAAGAALGRASQLATVDARTLTGIALLQLTAADARSAAVTLGKALEADPQHLPAQALMVDADMALGNLAAAERRARDIASRHPRLGLGHALLGDVARARGQAAAAVEAYQRAQRLQPDSAGALRLFRAQAGLDGRAAVQTAQQWLGTSPRDATLRQALADFHASRGQWAEARAQYEALLQHAPAHAEALNNYAHVLLALRDVPGASRAAEAALAARPDAAHVLGTAGWVAYQAGQRDRALQLLREARLRDPANPDTRFFLATALAGAGRSHEAREELHAAMQAGTHFSNQQEAKALLRTLR